MKKILFPTTYSTYASHYFKYAAELAHKLGGELTLLHTFNKTESRTQSEQQLQEQSKEEIKRLKDFAIKYLPPQYDIRLNYHVRTESPIKAILTAAKEKEADIIVIGMKTKTGEHISFMGGIAREVLKQATIPVLVVPPTSKFSAIDKLVYANDFEYRDLAAMTQMHNWANNMGASLHCIHMKEKKDKPEIVQRNLSILRDLYACKKQPTITFESVDGKFEKEILNYTKENEVDILAMTLYKKGFWARLFTSSNTSIDIAERINIPILVLKYD